MDMPITWTKKKLPAYLDAGFTVSQLELYGEDLILSVPDEQHSFSGLALKFF
jgi:hypothetical protein